MIKQMVLFLGEGFNQSLAGLILTSPKGFPTVREALADFGTAVLHWLQPEPDPLGLEEEKAEWEASLNDCCRQAPPESRFCNRCGAHLVFTPEDEPEPVGSTDIEFFLKDLLGETLLENEDVFAFLKEQGWSFRCTKLENPSIVRARGEEVVARLALGLDLPADLIKDAGI